MLQCIIFVSLFVLFCFSYFGSTNCSIGKTIQKVNDPFWKLYLHISYYLHIIFHQILLKKERITSVSTTCILLNGSNFVVELTVKQIENLWKCSKKEMVHK